MNQSGLKKKKKVLVSYALLSWQSVKGAGSEPSIQRSPLRRPLTQTHRPQWKMSDTASNE